MARCSFARPRRRDPTPMILLYIVLATLAGGVLSVLTTALLTVQ
jgi:hypothetical protein